MFIMGITFQSYQSDNGIFASPELVHEIGKGLQNINSQVVSVPINKMELQNVKLK